MDNNLPYLVNLPPFMFRGVNVKNMGAISKLFFILKGKILSLIVNKTNNKLFCKLLNLIYKKDGKINFYDGKYIKENKNFQKIYYPNKRILRVVNNYEIQLEKIFNTYCINSVNLKNGDLVLDCGANTGELFLSIKKRGIEIDYVGFEPDKEAFTCLVLNTNMTENKHFNLGLSNKNNNKNFYFDSEGGNSSFIDFGSDNFEVVETKRLDSFKFDKKIKLLKIDAEGYEPEVLEGSIGCLENTEYISVDFGAERGKKGNTTLVKVNQLLTENNFQLIELSEYRLVGLYKNSFING